MFVKTLLIVDISYILYYSGFLERKEEDSQHWSNISHLSGNTVLKPVCTSYTLEIIAENKNYIEI